MCPAEIPEQPVEAPPADRDERLARIRRLIEGRGKDAASLVKTWLHQEQDAAAKRRK